ncbi:WD40 repeat-like protein [Laetiporus sulphureus 93-53]|uniref:Elongator complex protein 2 n=1 Tax=Laetiporus sulphureus 93-53 TaxID=1314785 RepID=A0A165IDU4_9APHY|nr:WD40 repeat-like protein [Laetiporus sulphureus 93-53]KZT12941.1 WD40 repeat-like protein [Laetiporus sulphureus 93-53]
MESQVTVDYVAASINRQSNAADVSSSSLVAFGSYQLVALWNAEDGFDRGVHETLPGHEGLVTCVRFFDDQHFVSADDQGVVRSWRRDGTQWNESCVHQAHQKAISALALYGDLMVTGASDSLVKVWRVQRNDQSDVFQEVQMITLRGRYALSLALSMLPGTQAMILAIGSTSRDVQIWTCSEDNFVFSATLSGHEDWVRSLAFQQSQQNSSTLVLASGSQDATIRLWNVEPFQAKASASSSISDVATSDELLDAFEASLAELTDAEEGGRQISLKRHILTVKAGQSSTQQFSVAFDALLVGHEAGVTSLSWRPPTSTISVPTLLSSSTDSSLILWSPSTIITSLKDGATSIWINRQRFGDVGGQRLGGFVGGLWARGGMEACAWGWNGGWRRWRCTVGDAAAPQNLQMENWTEVGAITGHSAPVKGLSWSPNGEYLLSASLDQTTRIHGGIPTTGPDGTSTTVWHEIGRPQVHGYDLVGVSSLDPLQFVSIADEKVARVFEAPREFIEVVNNLGVAKLDTSEEERPRAATVPPLGLSNKAVLRLASVVADTMGGDGSYDLLRRRRRPFEGELAAITLWPEIEKIFGHGYESISLAASTSKKLIATACKATSLEHAVVRIYDTERFQPVGEPLAGHTLTVTAIAFSPDDRYVLSVSRDRSWRLFERDGQGQSYPHGYVSLAADRTHARIIWDCAWAPEGDIFATASRDKTVKIWRQQDGSSTKWTAIATLKTIEAATAVTFIPPGSDVKRVMAVGLESGEILLYSCIDADGARWTLDLTIPRRIAHIDHIHHLSCRPSDDPTTIQLASCSEDNTLKILSVRIARSK